MEFQKDSVFCLVTSVATTLLSLDRVKQKMLSSTFGSKSRGLCYVFAFMVAVVKIQRPTQPSGVLWVGFLE